MGRDVVYLPAKERGKKIIHFKKNYKTMTEDELKELFRTLEEQGWKPQLCDTPVPLYDVRVPCGPPTELGDTPPEVVMMPKDFLFSLQEFMVTVTGDSMVDADIEEGDVVTVEPNTPIHDGDIVLVMIDGETTLKSYCMDEEGQPWLVPQNTAYNAFRLSESNSVWVMGVVRAVEKRAPRVSYRACIKHIAKAKTKMAQPQPLTSEAAKEFIKTHLLQGQRIVLQEIGALQANLQSKCFAQSVIPAESFDPSSYIKKVGIRFRPVQSFAASEVSGCGCAILVLALAMCLMHAR